MPVQGAIESLPPEPEVGGREFDTSYISYCS